MVRDSLCHRDIGIRHLSKPNEDSGESKPEGVGGVDAVMQTKLARGGSNPDDRGRCRLAENAVDDGRREHPFRCTLEPESPANDPGVSCHRAGSIQLHVDKLRLRYAN
jgi:hypothetical protein